MASVEFRDGRKSFGAFAVTDRVDISIRDGNLVARAGSSGCGRILLKPASHSELFNDARCQRLTA